MANVLTAAVISVASAVTRPESTPPERKHPHGTSHATRRATDARRRVSTPSAASAALGAASARRGGAPDRRNVWGPAEPALLVRAGRGGGGGPGPRWRLAQAVGVVDLAVRAEPQAAVLADERLAAAGQVDDAESLRGEADGALGPDSPLVRAAVLDGERHRVERGARRGPTTTQLQHCYDATHRQPSGAGATLRGAS